MTSRFVKVALAGVSLALVLAAHSAMASTSTELRAEGNAAGFLSVNATAAQTPETEGAKNFIASMGDRGINFLGDTSMTEEAKKAEFRKLLNDSFDMNTIARFSLGNNWNKATPAQQQEYLQLFNDMIVKVYSKRFSDYKGQKFDVRSARQDSGKDAVVSSFIIPEQGAEVKVDWRVRNKGGAYKVVDIIVEGVSMSQTQRSDFNSVIQRGGGNIDVLLTHLRQQ
jgi:phospholipid transport system substrate-binding protein